MSSSPMDELVTFVAVAEAGGFTAAARRLSVTTNAVSLRIQRLEQRLGVLLFVRTTRRVSLTDEGRTFFGRISPVLAELEAAQEEIRPGDALRGRVRIAVPGAIATGPFLERLGELLDRHAGLAVQLRVTNSGVDPAAEGLDIALVVGQVPQSSFVGRFLGRATWVLAATPAYLDRHGRPATPTELTGHQCLRLLSQPPQSEWVLVDRRGKETVVAVGGSFEADDSRALGDAAYAGLGIGIRPLGECDRETRAGRLERVLPAYRFQSLDVSALLPKGRVRVPAVSACLEALRHAVRELS